MAILFFLRYFVILICYVKLSEKLNHVYKALSINRYVEAD